MYFSKSSRITEENFFNTLKPVYDAINLVSRNELLKEKNTIGFVGAPWTLLVYVINKQSPKKNIDKDFFNNNLLVKNILDLLIKFTKIHIKNQVDSGANLIQIFDSWAGLLEKNDYDKYIYNPTLELVDYVKTLKVPVVCFPRGIKDYKNYCEIIKPNAVNIDYDVDPHKIQKLIKIPIQGGLDPKVLLTDKHNLKKEANKYLEIFKDHPYIFNLGHGVLPETNPDMVEYLVNIVKDYK